jgi:hypothetical protein
MDNIHRLLFGGIIMEFTIPTQFNGVQLQNELKAAGVKLNDYPRLVDDKLVLDIAKKDETKTQAIVDAHVAVDNSAAIAAQRQAILDRVGLTADELALLLS